MSTQAAEAHALAHEVRFTDGEMIVSLVDERTVAVPLVWFPRFAGATKEQLESYELLGDGEGIHWPHIDEGLSVEGLLRGRH